MEKVFIMLPVHNRRAITQRFIESLVRQHYRNYHLVLIDDGSSDDTEEMVRFYLDNLTVIRGDSNWWWGGALQQGYMWLSRQSLTEDDVVLIMNDDTEFEPDYLATGLEVLGNNQKSILVSQCYDRRTKALVDPGTYFMDLDRLKFRTVDGDAEVNCTSTRGLFMRATDMLALGGFYPKLLPHYLSDIEYTLRAHKKGLRLLSNDRLVLFLDDDATGYHGLENESASFSVILKRVFSRKSSSNPVYWTSFIILACPWRAKLKNILLVWACTLYALLKQMPSPRLRGEPGRRWF
jgi:GT2 family glycosyltransferase